MIEMSIAPKSNNYCLSSGVSFQLSRRFAFRRLSKTAFGFVLILMLNLTAQAQEVVVERSNRAGSGDTDIVLAAAGVSLPLGERVRLNILGLYGTRINIESASFELPVTINKHFSFAPGYARVRVAPEGGSARSLNRLQISGTATLPLKRFAIESRSRLERVFNIGGFDETRYSNRFRASFNVAIKNFSFVPFVDAEPTYSWRESGWTRQRYSVGARKIFREKFVAEVSYLRQNDSERASLNGLVIAFVVRFKRTNSAGK